MFVASDSFSDLPVFPLLERASRYDMLSFLHTFLSMKSYLPDFLLEKLLDSVMDAIPVYEYCKAEGIQPFIDLKKTNNGHLRCKLGLRMHRDGYEPKKISVNTGVQKQTAKKAASAIHLVHLLNTDELYIHN